MYKILRGDNQSLCDLFTINEFRTRGNNFKLYKLYKLHTTIRKHFFSIRVISNWNSLPYEVVNEVSLDSFKSKFDNAWEDKIYVLIKKIAESSKKILHTIGLVVSTNSSSWVSFFGSLSYTSSQEKRNSAAKKSENNLQRSALKNNIYSFSLNRIFREPVSIFILVR